VWEAAVKYGRPLVLLAVLLAVAKGSVDAHDLGPHDGTCSGGWLVTGYFTVRESDFDGARIQVTFEDGRTGSYRSGFLDAVKVEGWGSTEHGGYIGYDDGVWRLSSRPLADSGQELRIGSIAVDPAMIHREGVVTIPSLRFFGEVRFRPDDVGPAIRGKHVDVYTGEGRPAQRLADAITGEGHTVCLLKR
jgi:3D (Asp-Asp-Asp) domain-containing protein